MECSSCKLSYTPTDRRPKKLPCDHLLCGKCVEEGSKGGELLCPQDRNVHIVNDDTEFLEDMHVIERLEAARLRCHYHQDVEASMFCPTHLLALCEQCHSQEDCKKQMDVYGDRKKIKTHLRHVADELNTDRVSPMFKVRIEEKHGFLSQELLKLCRELMTIEFHQWCINCLSRSLEFVRLSDMCLFCKKCYQASINTDRDSAEQFAPFDERCRPRIKEVLSTKLQKLDFFELKPSHHKWMSDPPANMLQFFWGAKEIINLENQSWRTEDTLPDYFICPGCKETFSRGQSQFRRLPCRDAIHALCGTCGQYFDTEITCPLDLKKYHVRYSKLPALKNTDCPRISCEEVPETMIMEPPHPIRLPIRPMDSPIIREPDRRVVGSGKTLSNKGIHIPPFQCTTERRLQAADRFYTVLPPDRPIPGLNAEEKKYIEPFFFNYVKNQVEVLSFCSYDNARLWGVGIANLMIPGIRARVQWMRLYNGKKAVGPNTEMRLLNYDLVGDKGVITDIYFESPYSLQTLQFVTLKAKISSNGPR